MTRYIATAQTFDGTGASALPVLGFDWDNIQRIAVAATAAQSTAISSELICLKSTTACYIKIGDNPTATVGAGSFPLAVDESFFIRMTPGQKLSVIRASADGFISIMPVV